jgi:Tfp pilus assembly protein PilF
MNLGASYLSSALISSSSEDFKRAKYYLTNAVELKPSSGDSHHYLSIVYKETGDLKSAEIHASKALKLGIPPAQKRDALRILDEIQNSDFKKN